MFGRALPRQRSAEEGICGEEEALSVDLRGPVGGFRVVRGDVEPDIDQVVLGPSCTANDRQCGPVTLCRAQRSRACCSSVKRRPASALTPGAAGKTLGPEPP